MIHPATLDAMEEYEIGNPEGLHQSQINEAICNLVRDKGFPDLEERPSLYVDGFCEAPTRCMPRRRNPRRRKNRMTSEVL